jgi:glycogen debranching enzyme
LDVEYNAAIFPLTLWPDLLKLQLQQWPQYARSHEPSGGAIICHDLGSGINATGQRSDYTMEVEENSNYLLLLQAYVRWTGDRSLVAPLMPTIKALRRYLLWVDRDGSGFPTEGATNTLVDGPAAIAFAAIFAERRAIGRPIGFPDCQIAATARARGAAIATRNLIDFEGCGVAVLNPWDGDAG